MEDDLYPPLKLLLIALTATFQMYTINDPLPIIEFERNQNKKKKYFYNICKKKIHYY